MVEIVNFMLRSFYHKGNLKTELLNALSNSYTSVF